jgi:Phospholipase_D-nuclease N-terminal
MLAFFSLGGGEIIFILVALFILPLTLLGFVFWIWMLIDSIKNERLKEGEKIAWVLVIALTHLLGAIIYFFAGRSRRA